MNDWFLIISFLKRKKKSKEWKSSIVYCMTNLTAMIAQLTRSKKGCEGFDDLAQRIDRSVLFSTVLCVSISI